MMRGGSFISFRLAVLCLGAAVLLGAATAEGQGRPPTIRFLQDQDSAGENKDWPAAYSPDRKTVLKCEGDAKEIFWKAVRLYDAGTGKPVGPPVSLGRPSHVTAMAVSPDGRTIAVARGSLSDESGHVTVFDGKTGTAIAFYGKPLGNVRQLRFEGAGTVVIEAPRPGGN
jgi:hypothetical protein